MEENNKNAKNILIGILLIISILLGGYLVYDKFIKNDEIKCRNIEEKESPTNEKTECNCSSDNEKSNTKTCGCEKCLTTDINYTEVFKDNKDYNGMYSAYYDISLTDDQQRHAYAWLTMDGKVKFKVDNGNNQDGAYILNNINNAVDIIFDDGIGGETLYILCKNGDVYKYSITNYENKTKTATKVSNLKDIIKFVKITSCPAKNSGCFGNLGVIDKNMQYKEITTLF